MPEVEWAKLKAHELRDLAGRNAVVILPVAAIEQHGPHLPVMTDSRIGGQVTGTVYLTHLELSILSPLLRSGQGIWGFSQ